MAATRSMFELRRLLRKLWVRTSVFAVAGVAVVVVTPMVSPFLPEWLAEIEAENAVESILAIIATSMLAVTTFSVSIMLTAYGAASQAGTPRAVTLLKEDVTSQMVLATFLGAFLFSLFALIGIRSGVFDAAGRVVLFFATMWVTLAVVVALVRWITHLTDFGRLSDTVARVETAAIKAMSDRVKQPYLGGVPAEGTPESWIAVYPETSGYLCHIDMPALQSLAKAVGRADGTPLIQLDVLPGAFVHRNRVLAWLSARITEGEANKDCHVRAQKAFTVGEARSFDQDPRFGLSVLSEIAERALSPAVNDPGTALDVLGRQFRVLDDWADRDSDVAPDFPLVAVPGLSMQDLLEDAFAGIARDGAGVVSVQLRLQKVLIALVQSAPERFAAAALQLSDRAVAESASARLYPEDQRRIEQANEDLRAIALRAA
ncbi:MAG: DUF2254 domain-containing protein [Pseudotabrizicola sp.]|uniref:DUF2254 domain-containing protein n=1 Tax=Pseudotabrizicola sp. TaxID=2939647 RepID=UPI0027281270|nr:DUF2254 domain-containing protein [Pseudotabrizicola sp.]MDO8882880.1 DUF2254 domain-containing protein [Pseudotabrizicola sp.]MDP2081447.1 DUF2254 domain-containing protein [Pseudotabrizicola sp.]MDZ7572960.1 DUF2254 domain-containing protein [Pseudotabrizicola sp.]